MNELPSKHDEVKKGTQVQDLRGVEKILLPLKVEDFSEEDLGWLLAAPQIPAPEKLIDQALQIPKSTGGIPPAAPSFKE